jgi:hypothetical protein
MSYLQYSEENIVFMNVLNDFIKKKGIQNKYVKIERIEKINSIEDDIENHSMIEEQNIHDIIESMQKDIIKYKKKQ